MAQDVEQTEDHAAVNADLLSRLAEAKRDYAGPRERQRDMLRDPRISGLVNQLLLNNQGWLRACVKRERARMGLRESLDDLASTAVAGKGGSDREVAGVMGAILGFDPGRHGAAAFTGYLRSAVHNALALTPGERLRQDTWRPLDDGGGDEPRQWADRGQRRPEQAAISAELMGVLERNVRKLVPGQRAVAEFVIGKILGGERRPTSEEVGEFRGVSKARGGQLYELTFNRLQQLIALDCPDLGRAGVGGWAEFSRAFGKTRTAAAL